MKVEEKSILDKIFELVDEIKRKLLKKMKFFPLKHARCQFSSPHPALYVQNTVQVDYFQ